MYLDLGRNVVVSYDGPQSILSSPFQNPPSETLTLLQEFTSSFNCSNGVVNHFLIRDIDVYQSFLTTTLVLIQALCHSLPTNCFLKHLFCCTTQNLQDDMMDLMEVSSEIQGTVPILALKVQIASFSGVIPEQQRLIFRGRVLEMRLKQTECLPISTPIRNQILMTN